MVVVFELKEGSGDDQAVLVGDEQIHQRCYVWLAFVECGIDLRYQFVA